MPTKLGAFDPATAHCVALRNQLTQYDFEENLLAIARKKHPTIAWWHGYRQAGPRFGAYCYVCDTRITTWARNFPITQTARKAIEDHKFTHQAEIVSAGRNSTRKG